MLWRSRNPRARSPQAPAAFINPCLPSVVQTPPTAAGWAHEIKHDGFRAQIHVRNGRARLYTMTGHDWSDRYPRVIDAGSAIGSSAIIDAEVIVQESGGVANFDALAGRTRDQEAVAFCFDLLMVKDIDLRSKTLAQRKQRLLELLYRTPTGFNYVEHVEGDGEIVFKHACAMGLEGIVSKKLSAPYRSGRSKTWVKTKNPNAPAVLRFREELHE